MDIKKKETNRTVVAIIAAVVLLLLFGFTALAYKRSWWPFSYFSADKSQEAAKEDNSNVAGQEGQSETKTEPVVDEPTEEIGGDASITITKLAQEGNTILLRADLENTPDGGRCIAYFSSEGGSVAKYATLTNNNGNLTCSLDANAMEFSYLGTWSVRLVYSTPDEKKVETTGDVNIE